MTTSFHSRGTGFLARRLVPLLAGLMAGLACVAGPVDQWHWRNPWPQGAPLNRITYGNGLYAAAGGVGTNLVMLSADGTNWTSANAAGLYALTDITWGSGLFVAVDEYGGIASSPDGANWIVRRTPVPMGNPISAIAYGNGLFVAFAGSFTYFTSPDGATWTSRSSPGGINPKAVCFGNGRFVTAQGANSIYVSTTGTNWTRANTPTGFSYDATGATYGGGRFVFVGGRNTMASTDGMTWLSPAPPNQTLAFDLKGVTYGLSGYVAVGDASGLLYTSTNASNWVLRSSSVSNLLYGVTYADGRYVAVGNQWQIGLSTNSTDWTPVTKQAATANLSAVAWLDDQFVGVGQYGTIAVSSNGTDWEGLRTGYNSTIKAVTRGNGLFVAGDGSSGIYTSTNARNWASQTVGFNTEALAFGNGVFVATGISGLVRTSTNGTTWTARTSGTTANLRAVAFLNHRFWAVGSSGAVLDSTNGVNWNYRSADVVVQLEGITWLKDRYIAVALTGESYTSTDGNQWARHSDSLRWFYDVAANGRFAVAAGWKGIRYVTTDGANWTPVPLQAQRDLSSVAFGNGSFVAVGSQGTILQSDPLLEIGLTRMLLPEITVTGPAGLACRIESAAGQVGGTNWQTLTNLTLTNGAAKWTAPMPEGTNHFYRAVTE